MIRADDIVFTINIKTLVKEQHLLDQLEDSTSISDPQTQMKHYYKVS